MVQGFDALYGVSHQLSLVTSTVSARTDATGTLLAVTPRAKSDAAAIAGRIDCRFPWPPPFSFRAHWPEKNSRMATDNFALLRLVCAKRSTATAMMMMKPSVACCIGDGTSSMTRPL